MRARDLPAKQRTVNYGLVDAACLCLLFGLSWTPPQMRVLESRLRIPGSLPCILSTVKSLKCPTKSALVVIVVVCFCCVGWFVGDSFSLGGNRHQNMPVSSPRHVGVAVGRSICSEVAGQRLAGKSPTFLMAFAAAS